MLEHKPCSSPCGEEEGGWGVGRHAARDTHLLLKRKGLHPWDSGVGRREAEQFRWSGHGSFLECGWRRRAAPGMGAWAWSCLEQGVQRRDEGSHSAQEMTADLEQCSLKIRPCPPRDSSTRVAL